MTEEIAVERLTEAQAKEELSRLARIISRAEHRLPR